MKKILALVLALAMILMVGAAFADTVVTINPMRPENADESTTTPTYTYYAMMKASISGNKVAYYVENETLANALDGLSITKNEKSVDLFTVTASADGTRWNVIPAEGLTDSDGPAIAAAMQTIKSNAIATGNADANNQITLTYDAYILIESSLGTVLAADTVTTKTINEKNTYPGNTKTEDKSTASYGEVVTYTITVDIPANVANLPIDVIDTITNGLTMDTTAGSIALSGGNVAAGTTLSWTQNGTIAANAEANPPVKAATIYKTTIPAATVTANAGETLTLTYHATVNADAIVNDPEVNKAHIEYDNFSSVDVTVTVITHGFTVRKIDGANVTADTTDAQKLAIEALAGAEFSLWTAETGGTQIKVTSLGENVYKVNPEAETSAVLQGGEFTINGLAAGTYYLQEDKAPDGYNKLTARVQVEANENTSPTGVDYAIENNAGSVLPSTGGIGTTIFYVLGGILVIGAAVILVARRKAHD